MTLETFKGVAIANSEEFVDARTQEATAKARQATVWLRLGQAKVKGLTADEHYEALPSEYTDRVNKQSFSAIWSLVKRILGACSERGLDPFELVATRGGLESVKAHLWPTPVVQTAPPKPESKAAPVVSTVVESSVSKVVAPEVTKVDPEAVIDQIVKVGTNLPTDRLEKVISLLQAVLQERQAAAAPKDAPKGRQRKAA